ncbi:MAG: hypothetical protein JJLCMIEE_03079 [Acidimicrobiales bacterium]|nr:MAG: hypothetical protein EDR02_08015 [Actinomycetota bacterium]MBV6509961.1 hypothetical protein [Acidimicrobiales bacterium]RIK08551.1 MAG: hypothetical protein DCC48_00990 [Acidobacteriota bacterium]
MNKTKETTNPMPATSAETNQAGGEVLIELDSRRRASLGKIGHHDRYLASEQPDGTVILTPAIVISQLEARFMQNPALINRIEKNRATPSRLRKLDR